MCHLKTSVVLIELIRPRPYVSKMPLRKLTFVLTEPYSNFSTSLPLLETPRIFFFILEPYVQCAQISIKTLKSNQVEEMKHVNVHRLFSGRRIPKKSQEL